MRGRHRWCGQGMAMGLMIWAGNSPAATLAEVFVPHTLGASVATLEQATGAAVRSEGETRHYLLNGCTLDAVIRNGKVVRLGLDLNATCSPDLSPFLALRPPRFTPAYPQTLGHLSALGVGLHYESDCLAGCDDLHQSHLYGYARGDQARGGFQVLFVANTQTPATFKAGQAWRQAMAHNASDVYVMEGTFNCDGLMDHMAAPLLKNVEVERVWVAQDDMDPGKCH